MKVIVCTGSPGSGLTAVSKMLSTAGVSEALPAEKHGLTPTKWHEQLLRKIGNDFFEQPGQMKPSGSWENMPLRYYILMLNTRSGSTALIQNPKNNCSSKSKF